MESRSLQALGVVLLVTGVAHAQNVTRVSVDSNGNQSDGVSCKFFPPAISGDGLLVAFESDADDLVSGDTNGWSDVFVHDRASGTTVRVSVDSNGNEGDSASDAAALSADGRWVAFESAASNLVPGDTNTVRDIFVHDRWTGQTSRVSVDSAGAQANSDSSLPALSADGQLVVFESTASNLVAGDVNQATDVFVHDLGSGATTLASVSSSGGQGDRGSLDPAISGDGIVVAFVSYADDLIQHDTNGVIDVFVHDRSVGTTVRVSVDSSGTQADGPSGFPWLSDDGSMVAFESDATNLVASDTNGATDVFLRDRTTNLTTRESVDSRGAQANGRSRQPSLSSDGQVVTFWSSAGNLDDGDSGRFADVFRRDRLVASTRLVSTDCAGNSGNGHSKRQAVSANGQVVAFSSDADDLVSDDTNGVTDVFVNDFADHSENASSSSYGAGLPGTLGVPTLTASAPPAFGTKISIDASNSSGAWSVGLLLAGWSSASIPTSAGGTLLVDPTIVEPFALPTNGWSWSISIPRDPNLCGVSFYLQTLEYDSGAQENLSFTPGLQLTFGH